MKSVIWLALGGAFLMGITSPFVPVYAQQAINVTATQPCFLNASAGFQLFENCGMGDDYIQASLLPWEWVTGGNFSMALAAILCMFTYIKYHKAMYPILIGAMMLPISFFVFPDTFLSFAGVMAFVTVGIIIWYVYIRQTKESGF